MFSAFTILLQKEKKKKTLFTIFFVHTGLNQFILVNPKTCMTATNVRTAWKTPHTCKLNPVMMICTSELPKYTLHNYQSSNITLMSNLFRYSHKGMYK